MTPFPCDGCGLCCFAVKCEHLDTLTKRCKIYNNRPTICNVNAYWEKHHEALNITLEKWHSLNVACCDEMKAKEHAKRILESDSCR